ncbi:hypothetical protein NECAME_04750 [Necator americanus]|uniref:Uncharacterized protein n=1 Tax=Necator americanus TaxID=51031 RepID=W2SMI8_NECAM|nr:hypothetical protein NECAME_04750 [Necator americanus]ETN70899.1 hypothetical protein NECAME_04750 [Necator americanus]
MILPFETQNRHKLCATINRTANCRRHSRRRELMSNWRLIIAPHPRLFLDSDDHPPPSPLE